MYIDNTFFTSSKKKEYYNSYLPCVWVCVHTQMIVCMLNFGDQETTYFRKSLLPSTVM